MRVAGVRLARDASGPVEVVMTPHQGGGNRLAVPPASPQQPLVERRNLAARERLVGRLAGEFSEMPGLLLTSAQAARLLSLEPGACGRILQTLLQRGVLRTTGTGH